MYRPLPAPSARAVELHKTLLAFKAARHLVAEAKVAVPRAVLNVVDRAIQVHGGLGVTDDVPLAQMWGWHRAMRLFDGPDEVHLTTLARAELTREPTFDL